MKVLALRLRAEQLFAEALKLLLGLLPAMRFVVLLLVEKPQGFLEFLHASLRLAIGGALLRGGLLLDLLVEVLDRLLLRSHEVGERQAMLEDASVLLT